MKAGNAEAEIIGVVGDIRRAALTDRPRADLYFPFARFADSQSTMFVQTTGDPLLALPAVRTALRSLEPQIIVHGARTMRRHHVGVDGDHAAGDAVARRVRGSWR